MLSAIFSLAGTTLGADEAALFREADPVGYILFRRNIEDRDQVGLAPLAVLGRQRRAIHHVALPAIAGEVEGERAVVLACRGSALIEPAIS